MATETSLVACRMAVPQVAAAVVVVAVEVTAADMVDPADMVVAREQEIVVVPVEIAVSWDRQPFNG